MKLNIGAGVDRKVGFWNIDIFKTHAVDQIVDMDKGLPYEDNSIQEIYISHVLEHAKDLRFLMDEMFRVCKHGAIIKIIVPHFSSKEAFDQDHNYFFHSDSFQTYTQNYKITQRKDDHKGAIFPSRFEIIFKHLDFDKGGNPLNYMEGWVNRHLGLYENTFLRALNPAKQLRFILEVDKIPDNHRPKT